MRALLASTLLAASTATQACGYCVEDKIAAVYDHAAVSRALEAHQTVVFFAIDGTLHPGVAEERKLEKLFSSVPGIATLRLSPEQAAVAVAYDPKRTNLAAAQKALERKLAPLGLSLLPLRVMDQPGELASAIRR
jgi:hypothetical protein